MWEKQVANSGEKKEKEEILRLMKGHHFCLTFDLHTERAQWETP